MKVRYNQTEDFPVDIYYLMDLSESMKEYKNKLSYLGDAIYEMEYDITSNLRVGFGSFVDKVIMPFTSTEPKK